MKLNQLFRVDLFLLLGETTQGHWNENNVGLRVGWFDLFVLQWFFFFEQVAWHEMKTILRNGVLSLFLRLFLCDLFHLFEDCYVEILL